LSFCPFCHPLSQRKDQSYGIVDTSLHEYCQDSKRTYEQCSNCDLVSVPDKFILSAEDEKKIYDEHQNDPEDSGYRKFLSRTFNPLSEKISKNAVGLDFGCGPGPALSKMAAETGITMSNYDLYYFNDQALLEKQYDFITMTEVIEHIADPVELLQMLDSILKPKAILAVMTKRVLGKQEFKNWHYKNDLTHIRFYSIETFKWIAKAFNWRLEIIDKDVVFFYKN